MHEFGWDKRLHSEKLNSRPEVHSKIHKNVCLDVKMQVWCCVTLHSSAKAAESCKRTSGVREARAERADRCVDGSVPPVLGRGRAHAQRRRQQLQHAAGWKDGCAQLSLLSLQRRLTGGGGGGGGWGHK